MTYQVYQQLDGLWGWTIYGGQGPVLKRRNY
jgi:hypothetical protein